jgi:hypothetical protein
VNSKNVVSFTGLPIQPPLLWPADPIIRSETMAIQLYERLLLDMTGENSCAVLTKQIITLPLKDRLSIRRLVMEFRLDVVVDAGLNL